MNILPRCADGRLGRLRLAAIGRTSSAAGRLLAADVLPATVGNVATLDYDVAMSVKPSAVGVRELKDHASTILRRVRRGETVQVTDRGRPVALLVPVLHQGVEATLRQLARAGRVAWSGGKPVGVSRPVRVKGASVAEAVIEDRR